MRLFYDTEFSERGAGYPLELISIGVVLDDGREYLAVNAEFDPLHAPQWVTENVVPLLPPPGPQWKQPAAIANELLALAGPEPPVLWGRWAGFDHVLLAQIFGSMTNWPGGWPMYTRDLQQVWEALGRPRLPPQAGPEHNALADALHVRELWHYLRDLAEQGIEQELSLVPHLQPHPGLVRRLADRVIP